MTRLRARMPHPLHVLVLVVAAAGVSVFAAACGTQRISVAKTASTYPGAVLFNEHCSGCHSLAAAATYGSAANPRTREYVNGPNFNVRCERPLARILYAIANGGFSGAIMPQNIVVGQEATQVAEFVAKYSGRAAPVVTGVTPCTQRPIGQVPNFNAPTQTVQGQSGPSNAQLTTTTATVTTNNPANAAPTSTTPGASAPAASGAKGKKGAKAGNQTATGNSSGG